MLACALQKPHFHEWATALPGMICVSRKARNATFRNYVAAETATPTISCCACLGNDDMKNFYFAGVCRSKSVRPIDDGVGPSVDEFFTLAIGGMGTFAIQTAHHTCQSQAHARTTTPTLTLTSDAAQQFVQLHLPRRHVRSLAHLQP